MLWLIKDHRTDWPYWPKGMGIEEPPVCTPCVRKSLRLCPAMRDNDNDNAITIRAREYPGSGIRGMLYRTSRPGPEPVGDRTVPFGDRPPAGSAPRTSSDNL